MKNRKGSTLFAVWPLAAMLLAPLLGCDQPRRYRHQNSGYQQQLAADQRRSHEQEEQRHLDEERRRDREDSYGSRRY